MLRLLRMTGALLAALLATAALSCAAVGAGRVQILGFQVESDPTSAIQQSASGITAVGVDGLRLTGVGTLSTIDRAQLSQQAVAQSFGLRSELVVSNYSNATKNFSERLAFRTLRSPRARARLVSELRADVEAEGWDGVILDMELLRPRDSAGLVQLSAALRDALPRRVVVALTLSNNGDLAGFASDGYDLPGLAASGCQLILMAYDQHGPWEDTPGPVGSLGWTRAGLNVLLRSSPSSRIVLGVAAYGYGWRGHHHLVLSDAQARALAERPGAHLRWVPRVGEWTARLRDGTILWWSDTRSLRAKIALAHQLHLGGLAVWDLGNSDPITAAG